jgi:hypothetical protein
MGIFDHRERAATNRRIYAFITLAKLRITSNEHRNETLLKHLGFACVPHSGLWVSHKYRKAFSEEAVSDYSAQDLQKFLQEGIPSDQFWFYFRSPVPDNFKYQGFEVLKEMGLSELRPEALLHE